MAIYLFRGSLTLQQLLGTLALVPVELCLNQFIAHDPHLARKLFSFSNKILEIQSSTPAANLLIRFLDDKVRLSALSASTAGQHADARIAGKASELFKLLMSTNGKPLASPGIEVSGDAVFIQDLLHMLRDADVQLGDYLAPWLGEIATREITHIAEQANTWGKQARTNLHRSVSDYIKEEISLVPDGAEIERFTEGTDHLKLALDRAEARLRIIESRLDKSLKNQQLSQ